MAGKDEKVFSCRLTPDEWDDINAIKGDRNMNSHALFTEILDTAVSKKEKSKPSDLQRIAELENKAQQHVDAINLLLGDKDDLVKKISQIEGEKANLILEIDSLTNNIELGNKAASKTIEIAKSSYDTVKMELDELKAKQSGCLLVPTTKEKQALLQRYLDDMVKRKGYFVTDCLPGLIEPVNTDDNEVNKSNFLINSFVFLTMGGYFAKLLIPKNQVISVLTKKQV